MGAQAQDVVLNPDVIVDPEVYVDPNVYVDPVPSNCPMAETPMVGVEIDPRMYEETYQVLTFLDPQSVQFNGFRWCTV